ncbi:hypothetical protein JB92DRAFT_3103547 [Gautieria morchelliformis]|nr:hypothetical protein JB92DRAFT_3103547 [Gautieria morchelliformis]
MEQATKKMQKLFKSMIAQGLDPSSLLKSIPQSSAAPSGTDASLSSGTMSTYQEPEEDGSSSEEELTPPPSHYSSDISSAHTPNEATHGNPEATDSESEEENDSDGLSGDEYENKSSLGPIASISDSQDEEEDITPGHAKTTDSGDVDATDVSSDDNNMPARKKKRQELYCEFTWAELSHSIDPILLIPKRDVRSHCGKNLDLSLPMRKQVKAKTVLVELKVCEDFPLLRNFAGGWPVHTLIQQYLKNTTEQARKSALRQATRAATMPAASSTNLTHAPLPAAPLISTAKSKSKKKSAAASVQPAAKLVKSSKANRAPDNRQAAPPVVSDVPITKGTSSSKSKVRPHPNFAAVENHERDVTHDLETLDLGTASQSSKSKKKTSIAVAASMASKKGVSGVKRKKPVEDDDGPGPSKRYKMLESIPVPAKGKEKTAKKTKVAKGASDKKSSSTATGSSGVRKTKRQCWEPHQNDSLRPNWEELEELNDEDNGSVDSDTGWLGFGEEEHVLYARLLKFAMANGDDPSDEDWMPEALKRKRKEDEATNG